MAFRIIVYPTSSETPSGLSALDILYSLSSSPLREYSAPVMFHPKSYWGRNTLWTFFLYAVRVETAHPQESQSSLDPSLPQKLKAPFCKTLTHANSPETTGPCTNKRHLKGGLQLGIFLFLSHIPLWNAASLKASPFTSCVVLLGHIIYFTLLRTRGAITNNG